MKKGDVDMADMHVECFDMITWNVKVILYFTPYFFS